MMSSMKKLGSNIRRGEDILDPDWEARRQSMTRIERVGYVFAAAFCVVFGVLFFSLCMKSTDDGISNWPISIDGIVCLIGCGYFVRKEWIGKRKLPEE